MGSQFTDPNIQKTRHKRGSRNRQFQISLLKNMETQALTNTWQGGGYTGGARAGLGAAGVPRLVGNRGKAGLGAARSHCRTRGPWTRQGAQRTAAPGTFSSEYPAQEGPGGLLRTACCDQSQLLKPGFRESLHRGGSDSPRGRD